ncbi:hypothetical protein KHC23_07815 [Ancylobacter dichloromethanicus]|uniref:Uncharacterized protein n=1 Tax=Ancylobacter dichloromethanicus TaxID=518825 RepID=A0A9W6N038_9HYPH|nr:hypothetical protein [Ancylobacter dichloromethanicus]MBS7553553.1 hypothetical protein [Ancylobacter dichloromethanicus]GLK72612.1 hypothetical protein GCM10017643_27280 [Ancylobacter dichloromethanicus]
MSWLLAIVLDWTPWWLWTAAGGVLLAATFSLWRPILAILPWPAIVALAASIVGALAYLAGRNKGAAGALQRARDKEQARADDIEHRAAAARERADRDALSGGLRDDDGWRRNDG